MEKRGRKSINELTIISINHRVRLAPSLRLTEAEKATWLEVINAKPADWFGKEHIPLIEQYVLHISNVHVIKDQLQAMKPEWITTDEGLKRYDKLLQMHEREGRAISSLATRLRLTPQSTYSAKKAAGYVPIEGKKPWDSEE